MAGWRVSGSDAGPRGVGGTDPTAGRLKKAEGPWDVSLLPERARYSCARSTAAIETIPRALCTESGAVGWLLRGRLSMIIFVITNI